MSVSQTELLPLQMVRTLGQFHSFLPKDGQDSPVNAALYPSTDLSRFLPVTQPVEEGQELVVDIDEWGAPPMVSPVRGRIVLTPVRLQQADAVRAKLSALGIDEDDIKDALAWSRKAG